MTAFILKLAAMITMLIDHTGYIFFGDRTILRCIGRFAFPLYAFMIAEGWRRTHNRMEYGLRLAALALLSEIPYDLVFSHTLFNPGRNNVILTLLLGYLAVAASERTENIFLKGAAVTGFCFLSVQMYSSYDYKGVLLIFFFHCYLKYFKNNSTGVRLAFLLGGLALFGGYYVYRNAAPGWNNLIYGFKVRNWLQLGCLIPAFMICAYNKKKGPSSPFFHVFYSLFYPLHLILIYMLMR